VRDKVKVTGRETKEAASNYKNRRQTEFPYTSGTET
jgi:hypothetical protein